VIRSGILQRVADMTRKRNGFTLVELIVVIVLISVLAVYAAPKLSDMSEDLESPFYSMAMSRIRSVQEANMTTDDGNCSMLLMAAGAIAEVRTGDGNCYDSDSDSIEIPAGVRNFNESSRFSKVTVKVGETEVKSGMMAVVSFDRIGNVRACAVVSPNAMVPLGNKPNAKVPLGNKECVITFGTDYVLTISKAGAVY
jgi:prepilin-type N-terminal cleavage/methylation domain-containing protein